MPSVTLDLPADVLDAANRLARDLNCHRAEVFARAVAAWSRAGDLEHDLAAARDRADGLARRIVSLAAQEARVRAAARAAAGDLSDTREVLAAAVAARRRAEAEIRLARTRAAVAEADAADARRAVAAAERRARAAEEREMAKSAAAVRDAEVARLRDHARDLAVRMQALEADLAHARMESALAKKNARAAASRAAAAERKLPPLRKRFADAEREGFRAERQIGLLLRERARLRDELRRFARDIAGGTRPGGSAKRPAPAPKIK
jgi:chromosome segregation protein